MYAVGRLVRDDNRDVICSGVQNLFPTHITCTYVVQTTCSLVVITHNILYSTTQVVFQVVLISTFLTNKYQPPIYTPNFQVGPGYHSNISARHWSSVPSVTFNNLSLNK